MKRTANLLLLLAIPVFCLCEEPKPEQEFNRWYFGVSAGTSEVEVKGHDRSKLVTTALQKKGVPVTTASGAQTDDDNAYSLLAGFRFHRWGAIEAQFIDLGEVDGNFQSTAGLDTLNGTIESSYRAASLSLVGHIPIWKRLELITRGGIHYWEHEFELKTTTSSNPVSSTIEDDGIDLVYGLGAEVTLLENLLVRAEWIRFQGIEDEDGIDTKSISLLFSF